MKPKKLKLNKFITLIAAFLFSVTLCGQIKKQPYFKHNGNVTQLIVEGEPTLLLSGELGNSSSSTSEFSRLCFDKCKKLGLNSVIAVVSWDLFEPEEGVFDYEKIDYLIKHAEEYDLKLIIVWFGAYKNGKSSYAPEWVKKDQNRFPRVLGLDKKVQVEGNESKNTVKDILSPFFEETWEADSRAFAALMKRIRQIDKKQTVVMVQVENEAGAYGVALDQQPISLQYFRGEVPDRLMEYLLKNETELVPAIKKVWGEKGEKISGTWEEIFGDMAIDAFMAWHFANFMEHVTVAGKSQYNIPMFYNAWLKQPNANKPGQYPTGGPIHTVLDIYRAASPSIDILAPDIYHPAFKQYCEAYTHRGNVLFVPECRIDESMVAKAYWTIAEKAGIGFAPFGIERISEESSLVKGYRILDQLMPLITERQGTNRLVGLYRQVSPYKRKVDVGEWDFDAGELEVEDRSYTQVTMGKWMFNISYQNRIKNEPAFGLILQLSENEFLITGKNLSINFEYSDKSHIVQLVHAEQGEFVNNKWTTRRFLNGDETAHAFSVSLPTSQDPFLPNNRQDIIKIKLYSYQKKVSKK